MGIFIFLVIFGTAMRETTTSVPNIEMTKDMWAAGMKTQLDLYSKYLKARQFAKIPSLFTQNCTVMPPGAKMGIGRKAIADICATLPRGGVDRVEFNSMEVILYGNNVATNTGAVILRTADGTTLDVGKFVAIWRLVDGTPLVEIAVWNSDTPTMLNVYAV